MILRAVGCILLLLSNIQPLAESPPPPVQYEQKKVVVEEPKWNRGQVTTYADFFEGRRMACGRIFRHAGHDIACRKGDFGRKVELRYGKNGRSVCIISDRGRLPLHQPDCWQFDVPQQVARELGLYRIVDGKTDRIIRWRYIE